MNGEDIVIRPALPGDAAVLLWLQLTLDAETDRMMLEPGEREADPSVLARQIEEAKDTGSRVFVAWDGDEAVGLLWAQRLPWRRACHTASLVIGVREDHRGRGVGKALFTALFSWAPGDGIHRLELTVMTHNDPAIALYTHCGFETEGLHRHSLRVGDQWVDELAMARLIKEEPK